MEKTIDNIKPILIFKGDADVCYGILRYFSDEFSKALLSIGENVIYFDPKRDSIRECFGKEYKAVVGFMESFFYNTVPGSNTFLFDLLIGPKFNYWPDHPAFYYRFVNGFPKNYYILTLDHNYVDYINKHYDNATAFFLPPGATEKSGFIPFSDREYGLSFLGTFNDYREVLNGFNAADEVTRVVTESYFTYMLQNPNDTTEYAFEQTLASLGAEVTEAQFLSELCKIHRIATNGAARFFKEQVIETIINHGITVDVFGDSWRQSPFAESEFLKIHPAVTSDRSVDVYRKSQISLNVMTWHKNSITERVLDSMACGSISLTDETDALRDSFIDGRDILYFSLTDLERIPDIIRKNLNNEEIALSGQKKVASGHTWTDRAFEFLQILNNL